jgi:hypothetical protein
MSRKSIPHLFREILEPSRYTQKGSHNPTIQAVIKKEGRNCTSGKKQQKKPGFRI